MTSSCVVKTALCREGMPSRETLTCLRGDANLMDFNKDESKVLQPVWGNPKHKHTLGGGRIGSSPEEKDG